MRRRALPGQTTGVGSVSIGVSLCERVKQIPHGKQRETKRSTPEIEIMTNAMLESPMHPRKQVKCFGYMSKYDHDQTSSVE